MKKILVIREFGDFSRILTESGFRVINLPLVETKPLDDLRDFEAKLEKSEGYDGFFLTSRHAAQIFADALRKKNISFAGKIYVLGKRSREILQAENLSLEFDGAANTAREMLEKIPFEDLKNKRFLFVRGDRSLRVVPEFLADQATVDETVVYETRQIALKAEEKDKIRKEFEKGEIAAACFFSPSGAESFLEQFDAWLLHQTCVATIGKTTAGFFKSRNLRVDFVSSKAAAKDFAIALVKHLQNGKWKMENRK